MQLPGTSSLFFVAWLLAIVPWLAVRSRRQMLPAASAGEAAPALPRPQVFVSTLVFLAIQFALAWAVGRTFGFQIFASPPLGARELLLGLAALGLSLALLPLSRALRSPAEQRQMAAYRLMPRTPGEWALYDAMALAAGVAEEAAYRGVLMAILCHALGNPWLAALVAATAFAAAHALQGWKSGAIIFAMALLMHALVRATGTLVVAMVVHATFDLVAGVVGARRVQRGEVDG